MDKMSNNGIIRLYLNEVWGFCSSMSNVKQKIRPSENIKRKKELEALRAEVIAKDNMRHRNVIYPNTFNDEELGCCVPYESVIGLQKVFVSDQNHARTYHKSCRYGTMRKNKTAMVG
jgi:hypothetical protein